MDANKSTSTKNIILNYLNTKYPKGLRVDSPLWPLPFQTAIEKLIFLALNPILPKIKCLSVLGIFFMFSSNKRTRFGPFKNMRFESDLAHCIRTLEFPFYIFNPLSNKLSEFIFLWLLLAKTRKCLHKSFVKWGIKLRMNLFVNDN